MAALHPAGARGSALPAAGRRGTSSRDSDRRQTRRIARQHGQSAGGQRPLRQRVCARLVGRRRRPGRGAAQSGARDASRAIARTARAEGGAAGRAAQSSAVGGRGAGEAAPAARGVPGCRADPTVPRGQSGGAGARVRGARLHRTEWARAEFRSRAGGHARDDRHRARHQRTGDQPRSQVAHATPRRLGPGADHRPLRPARGRAAAQPGGARQPREWRAHPDRRGTHGRHPGCSEQSHIQPDRRRDLRSAAGRPVQVPARR